MRLHWMFAFALLMVTATAGADTKVTVWLKDGGMVEGKLVERAPDDHITIELATGEVRRIEWKDVDHDSLGKPAKEPEPKGDDADDIHKPKASSKAVADYTPPDWGKKGAGGGAVVTVTGADGYLLQRLDGTFAGYGSGPRGSVVIAGELWKTECVAPCNQALPPGTYHIDGDGIPSSRSFTLTGGEEVAVSTGSSVGWHIGMFLTVAGVICVPVGIVMAQDRHQDLKDMGTTFLIAGGVGLAVGLPIWLLSRTTVDVKSSSGTSLRANGFVF